MVGNWSPLSLEGHNIPNKSILSTQDHDTLLAREV
ncbi:hypothetical protein FHX35_001019 [Auritidibacter ignavus]|nr:hypothetical protein [Auritidibacter ignavus]